MVIWFVLRMRNTPTWNGRWSGEGELYAKRVRVSGDKAEQLLKKGSFYWCWSDGWSCSVDVVKPDSHSARRMTKNNRGFMGYDWMVDSILRYGRILDTDGVKKLKAAEAEVKGQVVR
jgi:hypothetical protein